MDVFANIWQIVQVQWSYKNVTRSFPSKTQTWLAWIAKMVSKISWKFIHPSLHENSNVFILFNVGCMISFFWLNYFTPYLPSSYHKTFVISCHKQICGIQALLVQPCPWILNRPGTESKYKTFPSTKVWESLGARVSFSPAGCYKPTKDLLCDKCNIFIANYYCKVLQK